MYINAIVVDLLSPMPMPMPMPMFMFAAADAFVMTLVVNDKSTSVPNASLSKY